MRAFAYLDANSGSLIVSVIAAGGAGAAVAAKMGMQRLKKPFSRRIAGRAEPSRRPRPPRSRSPRTSDLSVTSGSAARAEPGSYRDPANRVFYLDDRVLRGLGPSGAEAWRALQGTRFFPKLLADGPGRPHRRGGGRPRSASTPTSGSWWSSTSASRSCRTPTSGRSRCCATPPSCTSSCSLAALDEGFTMSDGYAYNVQWQGTRPVFIDVGSFQPSQGGGPWAGYRQFCQTFLFPLMLQGHRGVAYRPLLRGQVDGITPAQASRLFSRGDWVRPGVFRHAVLHDLAERRFSADSTQQVKAQLRSAGFDQELVKAVAGQAAAARAQGDLGAVGLRLVRVRRDLHLRRRRSGGEAGVRRRGRAGPPPAARVRPRLQRRHLQPGGGRARRPRRGGRR